MRVQRVPYVVPCVILIPCCNGAHSRYLTQSSCFSDERFVHTGGEITDYPTRPLDIAGRPVATPKRQLLRHPRQHSGLISWQHDVSFVVQPDLPRVSTDGGISAPKSLRPYISALRNQPVSHISAFLILHELTALASIAGIAYYFHFTQWLPPGVTDWKWVTEGVEKYGNYFRRKGWLEGKLQGEAGVRLVLEYVYDGQSELMARVLTEDRVATAYAVTKLLMPARLAVSLWATPAFAKLFINPITRLFRR